MQISADGLSQLRAIELCRLNAYWDRNGWALGYGQHNPTFNSQSRCTKEDAETWLQNTTGQIAASVTKLLRVPVSQGQFDVLVIFAYNIGIGAFASSSLLSRLNCGNYSCVPEQLLRWVYSDHEVDSALVSRRQLEASLWKKASPSQNQTPETATKG